MRLPAGSCQPNRRFAAGRLFGAREPVRGFVTINHNNHLISVPPRNSPHVAQSRFGPKLQAGSLICS
jgi:hypothetical protein